MQILIWFASCLITLLYVPKRATPSPWLIYQSISFGGFYSSSSVLVFNMVSYLNWFFFFLFSRKDWGLWICEYNFGHFLRTSVFNLVFITVVFFFLPPFVVLGIGPKASSMLCKQSTTEPDPHPSLFFLVFSYNFWHFLIDRFLKV